jgi:hypothetical protein
MFISPCRIYALRFLRGVGESPRPSPPVSATTAQQGVRAFSPPCIALGFGGD